VFDGCIYRDEVGRGMAFQGGGGEKKRRMGGGGGGGHLMSNWVPMCETF
jgi:hypothetical protein